jgi:hypothetical protein
MSEITELYDFCQPVKPDGKMKLKRFLLICFYILLPIIALLLIVKWKGLVPLGAFIVLADAVVYFFTWRFVNLETYYSIKTGIVTYAVIQNVFQHRIKKEKMQFAVKDCTLIAPKAASEDKIAEFKPEIVYNGLSDPDVPDAYVALFCDADGKRVAYYFDATAEMLKRCRFYNREATVVTQVRY